MTAATWVSLVLASASAEALATAIGGAAFRRIRARRNRGRG
jgi:hypothetical protein